MENKKVINNILNEICTHFPEIRALMDSHEQCMTTSKMEAFAHATTNAIADGNLVLAQKYLNYIDLKITNAHPKEFEYIDVYYTENLFWDVSSKTKEIGWRLVPARLQKLYVAFHGAPPL